MDKLAIITVNYNNYQVTEEFLNCFNVLEKNKIFVSDLSTRKQQFTANANCQIIQGSNKGYAHGVNLGLKEAINQKFTRFCVINNDTRVKFNLTEKVISSIDKHPKSIIGGKIYYEKGFEYHKDRYKPEDLGKVFWYAGGILDWKNAFTIHRGIDEVDHGQYDRQEKTDFVTGCFFCFDKTVIDTTGFWDESYFLYYEDADYCERAKKQGVDLYYDPTITIWHKNAQSTQGSGSSLHQTYQNKNRLKFGLKYAPLRTKFHLLKNDPTVISDLIRDLF